MKKEHNQYKSYKPISRLEAALLNAVETHLVFSLTTIRRLTGWNTTKVSNVLQSLKQKMIIVAVKKNAYVLMNTISEHILTIATMIASPSYLSFWSACSYYGFTEQQTQVIQVVSTKQYPLLKIGQHRIEITTIKPKRWFGYQKINTMMIVEPEKLLIEALYKPERVGGMDEFKKVLENAWPQINQTTLGHYLQRFHIKAIFARLGFLLDELKLKNTMEKLLIKKLPKGFTKLNPSKKAVAVYNIKWRVMVND